MARKFYLKKFYDLIKWYVCVICKNDTTSTRTALLIKGVESINAAIKERKDCQRDCLPWTIHS